MFIFFQIDPQTFERKSAAIACRRFPGTHEYINIARMMEQIHLEFGLTPDKIVATVAENGKNFVKAFQSYGVQLEDNFFYGKFIIIIFI